MQKNPNFNILSFSESTLKTAKIDIPDMKGEYINFYGPRQSFQDISISEVLELRKWSYLEKIGLFRDKIVLIGATADLFTDFHQSPFSGTIIHQQYIPGVEILANDIASLMEGQNLSKVLSRPVHRGFLVAIVVAAGSFILIVIFKDSLTILLASIGISGAWAGLCYFFFLQNLLLPTIPALILLSTGIFSSLISLER